MFPAWSLEGVEGLVTLIMPSCCVMAAADVQQEIQVTNALTLLRSPGIRRQYGVEFLIVRATKRRGPGRAKGKAKILNSVSVETRLSKFNNE